jgi:hypothetical protein
LQDRRLAFGSPGPNAVRQFAGIVTAIGACGVAGG